MRFFILILCLGLTISIFGCLQQSIQNDSNTMVGDTNLSSCEDGLPSKEYVQIFKAWALASYDEKEKYEYNRENLSYYPTPTFSKVFFEKSLTNFCVKKTDVCIEDVAGDCRQYAKGEGMTFSIVFDDLNLIFNNYTSVQFSKDKQIINYYGPTSDPIKPSAPKKEMLTLGEAREIAMHSSECNDQNETVSSSSEGKWIYYYESGQVIWNFRASKTNPFDLNLGRTDCDVDAVDGTVTKSMFCLITCGSR